MVLERRRVPLIIVLINRKQRYEVCHARSLSFFLSSFVVSLYDGIGNAEDFHSDSFRAGNEILNK